MNETGSIADPDSTNIAQSVLASVAALKALAAVRAGGILDAMDWEPKHLLAWRKRLGFDREEAAEVLGIGIDGYIKLELGQRKLRRTYVLLARYYEKYGPLRSRR